ncbi:MAG: hypothetical protein ACXWPS_12930, partial [Ktedonobacteraceae bacterium]
SGYDQTQNGLGTWSKTKIPPGMRHLGMNQEQQKAHFHSLVSTFNVAVSTEAGLLRAAALNLRFGAVPQYTSKGGPQARKYN